MQSSGDQVVLALTEGDPQSRTRFPHPIALAFHLLFRIAALLTYLFCGLFSSSFVISFIVVLSLASLDFWTTKNVSGRLLVGLRWWNYVDDEGQSHWVFESRKSKSEVDSRVREGKAERRIFWAGLVGSQVVWALFLLTSFFSFKLRWLIVVLVCSIMNGANLYGYIRCKLGANQNVSGVAKAFLGRQLASTVLSAEPNIDPEQSQPRRSNSDTENTLPGS